MSFADRREAIGASAYWRYAWPRRYGFALIMVAVATLLRYPVRVLIGPNLPFVLFYPAILLVSWIAGLGPGVINVPTLRERRTDIPILVDHFVRKHSARMGKHIDTAPDQTMTVLQNWNWPGNISELENMIERMVILSKGRVLAESPVELDAPQEITDNNLTEMERDHIIRVLRETNGVLAGADGAAGRLGIKRTTLQSMLIRFGIELQDCRNGSGTFGPG